MPELLDSSAHHVSHVALAPPVEFAQVITEPIDAIIVPSARPAESLSEALRLANELNRPLLVLCSRASTGSAVMEFARRLAPRIDVNAVDVDPKDVRFDVEFETTEMLDVTEFRRLTDTSVKRNLGLLIAHSQGWKRILFLDDDVEIPDAGDIRRAGSKLGEYAVVGMKIGGFPDNSVVCHANRGTGNRQDTFIGAGAMVVNLDKATSFFPNVYNEDWLFLLDTDGLRHVTITPTTTALQKEYDPFADPTRATQEEFGDVIAEGIFGLLDEQKTVHDANVEYWRTFLRHRFNFIKELAHQSRRISDVGLRHRMLASLDAALDSLNLVTAEFCANYLKAWQRDLVHWQARLDDARTPMALAVALKQLGLDQRWFTLPATHGHAPVEEASSLSSCLTNIMQDSGDSTAMPSELNTARIVASVGA